MTFPSHKAPELWMEQKMVIITLKSTFYFVFNYVIQIHYLAQIGFNKCPMQTNYMWTLKDEKNKIKRISSLEQHKIHRIKTRPRRQSELYNLKRMWVKSLVEEHEEATESHREVIAPDFWKEDIGKLPIDEGWGHSQGEEIVKFLSLKKSD